MNFLPSGVPRGALALVLLVACFRVLPCDPLGRSLVVQCHPASCSLLSTLLLVLED
jgi:hypothetical protein